MSTESAIMTTANSRSFPSPRSSSVAGMMVVFGHPRTYVFVPEARRGRDRSAVATRIEPEADRRARRPIAPRIVANDYTFTSPRWGMDDIDPDVLMIAVGVALSLIAVMELYPAWKRSRQE